MRVALVSIFDPENNAVRMLADYLRRRDHHVLEVYFKDWKNNALFWPSDEETRSLVRRLKAYGVELVGFSLRASAYLKVFTLLAQRVRQELRVPLLVGGIHATVDPESVLELCDFVVRGEAEQPVAELLERLQAGQPTHDVANIWCKVGDKVHRNELRPLCQDLAEVSRRDFLHPDKVSIDGSHVTTRDPMLGDSMYLIMASRGCPYRCSFCYNSTMQQQYKGKGRYWRLRPVDDVIDELRQAKLLFSHMRRVRFDDEVFPVDKQWVRRFVEQYRREVGLPFECLIEPKAFDAEQMRELVKAGLDSVYMGIQANDRVSRELYDRDASNAQILATARAFRALGIDSRFQVMVDDPYTTNEDRRRLFELLLSFPRPYRIYMFSMTVMPGTELAQRLIEQGSITPDDVEGAATKTFSQYRMSLDWDRPPDERFWIAMMVLVNKPFWPRTLLRRIADSAWLQRNPGLLTRVASLSNIVAMAGIVPSSIIRGEVDLRMLRRFWTPGKWITS